MKNNNKINLSFASQNVRSLNVTSSVDVQETKINCIAKNKSDIIFMSDLRLNSLIQKSAVENISKKFLFLGYDFFHNSLTSNRGVGILIRSQLGAIVTGSDSDPDGNYLILNVSLGELELTIGSIYGPNINENIPVLDNLLVSVSNMRKDKIILGGDWNCTWDDRDVASNIDCLDMASIPSKRRSEKVKTICNTLNLSEPFRTMYPNRKEFSYIPAVREYTNRSRLDFFLISEPLLTCIKECHISPSLLNSCFDHKMVFLSFGKKVGPLKNKQIRAGFIDDCILGHSVRTAACECFIQHALVNEVFTENTKADILLKIGSIFSLIDDINNNKSNHIGRNTTEAELLLLDGKISNLDILVEELPDSTFLEALALSCNPEFFFEALCCATRTWALKQQSEIYKYKCKKELDLKKQLNVLKEDYLANGNEISALESELTSLLDFNMRSELAESRKFEQLNSEKITPYFISLARCTKTEATLEQITREDGTDFENPTERDDYIVKSFEDLYKKPNNDVLPPLCISNFLGEVNNNIIVEEAKLNLTERNELERDLTIDEFDQSINHAKMKSAPGADGLSNKFIKKFWSIFRVPLFRLANHCYTNGKLSKSFSTANIKLIPKKGNLCLLKNWRPISLLSCFYKIISRVISNRLKKYMDKLTPTSQKGYSSTRRCQEVLIGLIDGIKECIKNDSRSAILSLDIRKAFDTISHQYIEKVLDHFNFGCNFKKWLLLLSTNRQASIILENGKISRTFKLKRGNAQGDIISPFLFLLGYQILLFKLQFDLQIIGTVAEPHISPDCPPLPPEVRKVPSKILAMADDANCLVRLDHNTLLQVKNILADFGKLSGLECNIEKTILIQVGNKMPIEQDIKDLGFEIRDSATILGLEISNNIGNYEDAAKKIREKIKKEINFWVRFRLSLPGRINIAKSMLLSQVNYTGSFLPYSKEQVTSFEKLVANFVLGNEKIAYARVFTKTSNGGLGMPGMSTFLNYQKCSWFKLALALDEHWKRSLYYGSNGNILNSRAKWFGEGTVLHGLCLALEEFRHAHTVINENFRTSIIFENKSFCATRRPVRYLSYEHFGTDPTQRNARIEKLQVSDFFRDGAILSRATVSAESGLELTLAQYNVIILSIERTVQNLTETDPQFKVSTSIEQIFQNFKKGSDSLKKIFTHDKNNYIPHNIMKYQVNTNTVIDNISAAELNKLWNLNYLDNSTRTFCFKLHNNTLGYNYTVSKFVRHHSPLCTFCAITFNPDDERETPYHIFYSCRHVENIYTDFFRAILSVEDHRRFSRQSYFGYFGSENIGKNLCIQVVCLLFKKYIWQCKLGHRLPNTEGLNLFVKNSIKTMYHVSGKFRKGWDRADININF